MTAADQLQPQSQGRFRAAFAGGLRYVGRHPGLGVALAILAVVVAAAVLAPWVAPHPEDAGTATNLMNTLQPPGGEHPLGVLPTHVVNTR